MHHFVHLVGNDDHGFSVVRHFPQRVEHVLRFLWCQDRRRFVQDQDLCSLMQQFDDLHTLLLADRKLPDQRFRRNLQIVLFGTLPYFFLHLIMMQEERLFPGIQKDILRHRQRRDEAEVLVHHTDPQFDGILGRMNVCRFSFIPDFSGVRPVDPHQDIHESTLAGPVFTQQGVDLTRIDGQTDILVRLDQTKGLEDMLHLQDRFFHDFSMMMSPDGTCR